MEDSLFARRRGTWPSLIFAVVCSLVLIWADKHLVLMRHVRLELDRTLSPLYGLIAMPASLAEWWGQAGETRTHLEHDNDTLRAEMLVLQGRLQRYAAVAAENARLRGLMNSNVVADGRVTVGEIIGLDPDPQRRIVLINRGGDHGLFVGQTVLDAHGLMGQVIQVGGSTARVLLIADPLASVPIEVNRNGVRGVVAGEGALDRLSVLYIPPSADVRPGDLLVTSGLGTIFPFGYPVAIVTRVNRKSGGDFSEVSARPIAELDRSSHVLLVFRKGYEPVEAVHEH